MATTTETHEFQQGRKGDERCYRYDAANLYCGQPRTAAIHRATPDYVVTVAPERVSVRDADRPASDTPPDPFPLRTFPGDAQDAPPKQLTVTYNPTEGVGIHPWQRKSDTPFTAEYILRSAHDAEVEKLREVLANAMKHSIIQHSAMCAAMTYNKPQPDCDCWVAAARAAIEPKGAKG